MKRISISILFIIISMLFISCQKGFSACCNTSPAPAELTVKVKSKKKAKEKKKMTLYPKMYADFANSSFQTQTVKVKGKLKLLAKNPGAPNNNPAFLFSTPSGLITSMMGDLDLIGYNGRTKWTDHRYAGLYADEKNIYTEQSEKLVSFDYNKKNVIETCLPYGRIGWIKSAFPFNSDFLFVHYQVYGPNDRNTEEHGHREKAAPTSTAIALVKKGWEFELRKPEQPEYVKYQHRFDSSSIALIAKDGKTLVLLDNSKSDIKIIDIATGKTKSSFKPEKSTEFVNASLDRNDNLVFFERIWNPEAHENKLSSYSIEGKKIWSISFGPGESYSHYIQPPAIDSKNRIYFIWNNELLLVENGKILRKASIPQHQYYQFVTITGDDSILLAASDTIKHIDKEGTTLFTIKLEKDETLSTPAVLDNEGNVYVGTTKGIRIIE